MSRGFGEVEFVQRVLPDWTAVPLALWTQLGDVWFLALLLIGLYWAAVPGREPIARVGGVSLAGLALLDAVKRLLALPRPAGPVLPVEALPPVVQPVYELTAFAAGYGFPSGHAVATTIVYLSLADNLSVGTRRHRYLAAGLLIVTVGFSRIALGVHYLVDVIGGIGVGLAVLLGAATALSRLADQATAALGLGVLVGGLNLLVRPVDQAALLLFGAALGSFAGWQAGVLRPPRRPGVDRVAGLRTYWLRALTAAVAIGPLVTAIAVAPLDSAVARSGLLGLGIAAVIAAPPRREPGPRR